MSVKANTRRLEAMMHALLFDHGYRADPDHPEAGPARRVYYHLTAPGVQAWLERIGQPRLPVAVTVLDKRGAALGMAASPERLRVLLERMH